MKAKAKSSKSKVNKAIGARTFVSAATFKTALELSAGQQHTELAADKNVRAPATVLIVRFKHDALTFRVFGIATTIRS
jgi:hypothetical protein